MLHTPCDGLTQKQLFYSGPGCAGRLARQRATEQKRGSDDREEDGFPESWHDQATRTRLRDDGLA